MILINQIPAILLKKVLNHFVSLELEKGKRTKVDPSQSIIFKFKHKLDVVQTTFSGPDIVDNTFSSL